MPYLEAYSNILLLFFPLAWKRYMGPSLDMLLMDCRASLNLLYIQVKLNSLRNFKS